MSRVHLHIERLVIEGTGLHPHQAGAFEGALREELARLFLERPPVPLLSARGAVPGVPPVTIAAPRPPASPSRWASAVASAVVGGGTK